MRSFLVAFLLLTICFASLNASAQNYRREVAAARELREMCEADRGRLWGQSLCGPLLVVDPESRSLWASEPDAGRTLYRYDDGWVGELPAGVPLANSAVEWSGVRWIMIVGPLPDDPIERRVLIAHEAWHRLQPFIGLAAEPSSCAHLETERGRYLLRLEMRALGVAVRSRGRAREEAVAHALAFRSARLGAFPGASRDETALDRNEGLAAYTGVVLGAEGRAEEFAARLLDRHDRHGALTRSYAYATGPAYGLILDDVQRDWRNALGPQAPADLAAARIRPADANGRQLERMAERYGGHAIADEERDRATLQRARLAELRDRFGGARVELSLAAMQFEFDPNHVTPVDGLGTVYQRLTLRDVWGEVVASQGALITSDSSRLVLTAPDPSGLSGPGWRLRLAPGYQVTSPDLNGVTRITASASP